LEKNALAWFDYTRPKVHKEVTKDEKI